MYDVDKFNALCYIIVKERKQITKRKELKGRRVPNKVTVFFLERGDSNVPRKR